MIEFHEAANIFPLDEESIPELAIDIGKHGLQVPIERLGGKIIDGRRRYMACEQAGVKPSFRDISTADPIAYVLSLNLHRRHLSESQRAMVAQRARAIYDGQARERMKSGRKNPVANLPQGSARDLVGKALGISGKSVDYARAVLTKGTQKMIDAVDSGKTAVSTAARMVSLLTPEQQDEFVENMRGRPGTRNNNVVEEEEANDANGKPRGVGIYRANEALDCLRRIPKNDPTRKRGFQIVTDWIRHNK